MAAQGMFNQVESVCYMQLSRWSCGITMGLIGEPRFWIWQDSKTDLEYSSSTLPNAFTMSGPATPQQNDVQPIHVVLQESS